VVGPGQLRVEALLRQGLRGAGELAQRPEHGELQGRDHGGDDHQAEGQEEPAQLRAPALTEGQAGREVDGDRQPPEAVRAQGDLPLDDPRSLVGPRRAERARDRVDPPPVAIREDDRDPVVVLGEERGEVLVDGVELAGEQERDEVLGDAVQVALDQAQVLGLGIGLEVGDPGELEVAGEDRADEGQRQQQLEPEARSAG
jgi:hypothetical protein